MFRKLLIGAVLAASTLTIGCGAPKDETVNPEAVPTITPSDRSSSLPGTETKNASGGKLAKPAN